MYLLSLWFMSSGCVAVQTNDVLSSPEIYFLLNNDQDGQAQADSLAAEYGLVMQNHGGVVASLAKRIYVAALQPIDSREPRQIGSVLTEMRTDERVALADFVHEFHVAGRADRPLRRASPDTDPYAPLQHSHITSKVTESHLISKGKNVKVAIIDTGIDTNHVDLRDRLSQHLNFVSAEQDTQNTEFHATAVAGIIGAEGNNGEGIIGVAPLARLYSLRACVENNPGSSRGKCSSLALARALDWAIVNAMQVINMSVQGQTDELVTRLINKAVAQGIVVVAATDLTDGQLSYPAKVSNVIAVSDQESNSLVGLAAHSQRIFIAPGEEILTTLPNDTYDFVTGASFAAAHVTGIIALLLEKSPQLNPFEVTRLLRESVRIINWSIIVDSCAALALIENNVNCRGFR